ncbi:MAG: hypothetical protein K2M94_08055 [Paramuribaculum sp.]|nr:hypothetical protein [Paramuribaculum sp.]
MSFTVTSCSDDDDPASADGNIIGTWKAEVRTSTDEWHREYMRFNENGTIDCVIVDCHRGEIDVDYDDYTWSKDGNKLTINGRTATIVELTSENLVLNVGDVKLTYKKCADSEMNQYYK